jgi:hypothetical protein
VDRDVRVPELLDVELGAVRVAGAVDEQGSERGLQLVGADFAAIGEVLEPAERDGELVPALARAFVGARTLRGLADAVIREPERQRRVVVDVAHERGKHVRVANER